MMRNDQPFLMAELDYRRERMTRYAAAETLRRRLRTARIPDRHVASRKVTRPVALSH